MHFPHFSSWQMDYFFFQLVFNSAINLFDILFHHSSNVLIFLNFYNVHRSSGTWVKFSLWDMLLYLQVLTAYFQDLVHKEFLGLFEIWSYANNMELAYLGVNQ